MKMLNFILLPADIIRIYASHRIESFRFAISAKTFIENTLHCYFNTVMDYYHLSLSSLDHRWLKEGRKETAVFIT